MNIRPHERSKMKETLIAENIDYLKYIMVCFRSDSKFERFIVEIVDDQKKMWFYSTNTYEKKENNVADIGQFTTQNNNSILG